MKTLPYGSWPSLLTADTLASSVLRFRELQWDGPTLYWLEGRSTEGGRQALVAHHPSEGIRDAAGPDTNVRTRVHEYGGGSFLPFAGQLYYSNFSDQRLHSAAAFGNAQPLTAEGFRFADGTADPQRHRLIAVAEQGTENFLAGISFTGGALQRLRWGNDFYAGPRISPSGHQLAWFEWSHPNMPWDESALWVADIAENGELKNPKAVANAPGESVLQPQWSPNGVLHFLSDRTGWWNLYRWNGESAVPLCPKAAEFGLPHWSFGESTYGFLGETRIVTAFQDGGRSHLAELDTVTGQLKALPCPHTDIRQLKTSGAEFAYVGGRPDGPTEVVRSDGKTFTSLRKSHSLSIDGISLPEAFTFPGYRGLDTHGFLYRPRNGAYGGLPGTKPPCLVVLHGGPTGSASTALELGYQYWTNRGFAVADINYGGSTGYGRAYRERLRGSWGVTDVEDSKAATTWLVEHGEAAGFAIRGGSAGGYTTLCALLSPTVFRAGASYYGVSDLRSLIADTHKFESRYDDFLIAPNPSESLLDERSPLKQADRLSTPVIFFQGLDDKVVPPNQSEALFQTLKRKGVLTAYVPFAGEGHGFRRADSQRHALECELYFYSRVFGFDAPIPQGPLALFNS